MGRIRANTALYLAGKRILTGIIAARRNTSIASDGESTGNTYGGRKHGISGLFLVNS